jgi:hypothetical protein
MHQQFNIQQLYVLPTLYLCYFVFSCEQTATCATYSTNLLVFITEMKIFYCAVRTGSLSKAVCTSFKRLNDNPYTNFSLYDSTVLSVCVCNITHSLSCMHVYLTHDLVTHILFNLVYYFFLVLNIVKVYINWWMQKLRNRLKYRKYQTIRSKKKYAQPQTIVTVAMEPQTLYR